MARSGTYLGGTRPRVSFKTQRHNKDIRHLALAGLDEDVPMAMSSKNNARQMVIRERGRGGSRGRNSPLPNRNFQGGQGGPQRTHPHRLGESDWYKICVSITYILYFI